MANATSAAAFIGTLGINTHLDFDAYGYQNLRTVESDIDYLGAKIVRDSVQTATDAQTWQQVAQATGAKFDDYIAETSPAGMVTDLGYVTQLASEGILASIEGGDEEDDSYPQSLGNTLANTALFQRQVYALGQSLGLPVINMSFGAGWTAANNWEGDYGTVGDLSAYADYANAHTYPNPGQLPNDQIQFINGLAKMAASQPPVMTTEIGWNTEQFDQTTIAKYVLDAAMDGLMDGDAGMYFYGLYDDSSGDWGLFNADGTPRPAATALHNLVTLLGDTGASATTFTPGSLPYSLSATQSGDSSVLIEKSNGSFWISLWNESEAANSPHTITVSLGGTAGSVTEYDPLTGTGSIAKWSNVSSVQVSVPDHPVLLEVVGAASGTGSGTGSGGTTGSGGGTGSGGTTGPTDPVITVPGTESVAAGATIAIKGVSVTDAFAASNPGTMVLNLGVSAGTISMTDGSGATVAGSGQSSMSVTGTFAQISADLANFSYSAPASSGSASISVNVWDQAGLQANASIAVTVAAAGSTSTNPPTVINIPSDDASPVITNSHAEIEATAGNHTITVDGTHDVISALGGTDTVMAFLGDNEFITGNGADTIKVGGANNLINATAGNNQIYDSGNDNEFVLPKAGAGNDDIYGSVLQNQDIFDFRWLLGGTSWNHSTTTIGDFVQVATANGTDATISVTPDGKAGGATYTVATLHDSGAVSLATLLAHSLT